MTSPPEPESENSVTDHQEEPGSVWVISDVNPDGSPNYMVTVQASDDVALTLNAKAAVRYATTVIRAAAVARHDAAIVRQLGGVSGLQTEHGAHTVADLRAQRPALHHGATSPLKFDPIVSSKDFAPYVHVSAGDTMITQWTPQDCFEHAGYVLEVLAGVDLDSAYLRYLMKTVGLDEQAARAVVHDLGLMTAEDGNREQS